MDLDHRVRESGLGHGCVLGGVWPFLCRGQCHKTSQMGHGIPGRNTGLSGHHGHRNVRGSGATWEARRARGLSARWTRAQNAPDPPQTRCACKGINEVSPRHMRASYTRYCVDALRCPTQCTSSFLWIRRKHERSSLAPQHGATGAGMTRTLGGLLPQNEELGSTYVCEKPLSMLMDYMYCFTSTRGSRTKVVSWVACVGIRIYRVTVPK